MRERERERERERKEKLPDETRCLLVVSTMVQANVFLNRGKVQKIGIVNRHDLVTSTTAKLSKRPSV